MKRILLTGILAMAAGIACAAAQAPAGQAAPAAPAAPAQPQPKSQEELKAVQALLQAQADPDATIKAAEELLAKFADTQFKEAALAMQSEAYRSKNQLEKAQIFAEEVLKLNPGNLQAHITIGEIITQTTLERALDREEQLAKAAKHLAAAQESLKTSPKPNPQLTDADWADIKKEASARVHNDFGMLAINRKTWDAAITEFNAAIADDPQPAYQARLASALQSAGKNAEAILICDKVLADPQLHPTIKRFMEQIKATATKATAPAPPK